MLFIWNVSLVVSVATLAGLNGLAATAAIYKPVGKGLSYKSKKETVVSELKELPN